ncbi:MAG: NAD-dependent epimerase/dehydratase family protein [Myxococcales bacterium]|nr:NAD-dependent epimerase/dehydratase family protein [Myxococcales bacterium]
MRIAVTGARGFVGRTLMTTLAARELAAVGLVRRAPDAGQRAVGDLTTRPDLAAALDGVDVVVHLAARVHVMHETERDPLAAFRRANVEATEHLARAAVARGARRFVYVSSVKVNGEATQRALFREQDPPHPEDPYGVSKAEAEQALARVAADTGLEVVVVRPPLVYGPGVGGNFVRMMRWLQRGVPLPLASVRNRRDLVGVHNLADALVACSVHPQAAGRTYLVADGEAVSTPALLRTLAACMHVCARLVPCPVALLQAAGRLAGKGGEVARLVGSLEIDAGALRRELGWRPVKSLREGLQLTADWFTGARHR